MKHKLISSLILVIAVAFAFTGCTAKAPAAYDEVKDPGVPLTVNFYSIEEYNAFVLASEMADEEIEKYLENSDKSYDMNRVYGRNEMLIVRDIIESVPMPEAEGMKLEYMDVSFYSAQIEKAACDNVFYRLTGDTELVLHIRGYNNENGEKKDAIRKVKRNSTKTGIANKSIEKLWYSNESEEGRHVFFALTENAWYMIIGFDVPKEEVLQQIDKMKFADINEKF